MKNNNFYYKNKKTEVVDQVVHEESEINIKKFFDFLRFERHLSVNTIASYKRDVSIFQNYIHDKNINGISDITHEGIILFLEGLFKVYRESSISRILSSLRTLYKFLLKENIVLKNPFAEISNPKKPRNLIEILDETEVTNFLEKLPHSTKLEMRDKAMFELLYSSGLRVSELVGLKLNDIDYEENIIRCIGKGNKERIVPVGETAIHYLKTYVKTARFNMQNSKSNKSTDFCFLNKNGGNLTRQGFWKILKKYEKEFNLNKNIYPHLFRHSYATHMLERGADLRVVQELLGHSSISTTEIYTNINKKFIKDSYFKNHPRDKKD